MNCCQYLIIIVFSPCPISLILCACTIDESCMICCLKVPHKPCLLLATILNILGHRLGSMVSFILGAVGSGCILTCTSLLLPVDSTAQVTGYHSNTIVLFFFLYWHFLLYSRLSSLRTLRKLIAMRCLISLPI